MKANAEHFFKDLEHCLKCKFTRAQAMVSSWLFSKEESLLALKERSNTSQELQFLE